MEKFYQVTVILWVKKKKTWVIAISKNIQQNILFDIGWQILSAQNLFQTQWYID